MSNAMQMTGDNSTQVNLHGVTRCQQFYRNEAQDGQKASPELHTVCCEGARMDSWVRRGPSIWMRWLATKAGQSIHNGFDNSYEWGGESLS